jgi:two-component system CheB/CheR fusion protein
MEPWGTRRLTKEGKALDVAIVSTALVNEAGRVYGIATTERLRPSLRKSNKADK